MRLIQLSAALAVTATVFFLQARLSQAVQKKVVELMMHEQHDTVNV